MGLLSDLALLARAGGSGLLGGAIGAPADTAVSLANLARMGYGYGGHKLGLLSAGQMPDTIDPAGVPGTSAWISKKAGVGDTMGEGIAEFVGGLLSPGGKKAPKKMDWTAYHGSPHKFDKFSLDKIGTGEGAQAYGHGLYFADNPSVAGAYRDILSTPEVRLPSGTIKGKPGSTEDQAIAWVETAAASGGDPFATALQMVARDKAIPDQQAVYDTIADWKRQGAKIGRGGALYKVDIDDAKAPKDAFLDWDKPLSEQSARVRKALEPLLAPVRKEMAKQADSGWGEFAAPQKADDVLTGKDVFGLLRDPNAASAVHDFTGGGGPEITRKLRELGIPGLRYLDAGSRGSGGTHNTVLFDDSLVRILGRE